MPHRRSPLIFNVLTMPRSTLLLIFLSTFTEVNPETGYIKPKLEEVLPGTNKWALTNFLPSLCGQLNTTIEVGVSKQESGGGWSYIGGAIKKPNKPDWITNIWKYEITPNGDFLIRNITREDNGSVYKFNTVGLDSREPVLIKLVYSPLEEPIITEKSPTPVIVTENETTTLHCYASGNPQPKIIWKKDGNNDSVLHEGVNYTIENTTREKAGNYLCVAQNGVGRNANASIPVTVHYPPSIEISRNDQLALEGSDIFLQCIATGVPRPTITWSKGDNQTMLHERGILLLSKVQTKDTGTYKCAAINGIGKPVSDTARLDVMNKSSNTHCSHELAYALGIFVLVVVLFLLYLWHKKSRDLNQTVLNHRLRSGVPESSTVTDTLV